MSNLAGMKKDLRRLVRYNGLIELACVKIRQGSSVSFPELDLTVDLGPGDIAIDCGAHVGDITSRLARTGATVHAFEPNPGCFAILHKRFSRMSNVVLHNRGVMEQPGEFDLRIPIDDDPTTAAVAGTFLKDAASFHQDERLVTVQCIALPDFIAGLGSPVKLLKMDIEGCEVAILDTMLDRGQMAEVGIAIVETHDRFSEDLARRTDALRDRIREAGLEKKIRLDWI